MLDSATVANTRTTQPQCLWRRRRSDQASEKTAKHPANVVKRHRGRRCRDWDDGGDGLLADIEIVVGRSNMSATRVSAVSACRPASELATGLSGRRRVRAHQHVEDDQAKPGTMLGILPAHQ